MIYCFKSKQKQGIPVRVVKVYFHVFVY